MDYSWLRWVPKNWCFWTVVLEKTLESHLECKGIQPVNPKGNQPWIFIRRTDAEAEIPILWPPDANSRLYWKRPWCWERLKAGEERDDRGWDGWMASPTQWTWVLANTPRWCRTRKPGLQSMGSQKSWMERLNSNHNNDIYHTPWSHPHWEEEFVLGTHRGERGILGAILEFHLSGL